MLQWKSRVAAIQTIYPTKPKNIYSPILKSFLTPVLLHLEKSPYIINTLPGFLSRVKDVKKRYPQDFKSSIELMWVKLTAAVESG
jgi:hypothetical protein